MNREKCEDAAQAFKDYFYPADEISSSDIYHNQEEVGRATLEGAGVPELVEAAQTLSTHIDWGCRAVSLEDANRLDEARAVLAKWK